MKEVLNELLDPTVTGRIENLGRDLAVKYQSAQPFPHIIIDDFLPAAPLRRAVELFPNPDQIQWTKFEDAQELKLAFESVEKLPADLRDVLYFLNSAPMIRFLEALTGIEGIIPDPYYFGGGLHQIVRGGHLEVHADFNVMPRLNLRRRLNLLLYLNQNWKEEYGGHLELWDKAMTHCEKKVLPIFNRCVVFSTASDSYHGHPIPLTCPEKWTRKSLATYYYTADPIDPEKVQRHSTLFQQRPEPDRTPPWKRGLKKILPPILVDAYKAMRGK